MSIQIWFICEVGDCVQTWLEWVGLWWVFVMSKIESKPNYLFPYVVWLFIKFGFISNFIGWWGIQTWFVDESQSIRGIESCSNLILSLGNVLMVKFDLFASLKIVFTLDLIIIRVGITWVL